MPSLLPPDLSFDQYCKTLFTPSDVAYRFNYNYEPAWVTFTCSNEGKIEVDVSVLGHNELFRLADESEDNHVHLEIPFKDALLFFCFLHTTPSMYSKYKTNFNKGGVLAKLCQRWGCFTYDNVSLSLDSKDIPDLNNKGSCEVFAKLCEGIKDEFEQTAHEIAHTSIEGAIIENDDEKCEHFQAFKKIVSSLPPYTDRALLDALFCATNRHLIADFYQTFGYVYDSNMYYNDDDSDED